MSLRVLLCSSIVAVCSSLTVYNPPNAGVALDAVEKALANIVNSPHLTKAQLGQAKAVAADVEKTVNFLESADGKKLSEKARGAKVSIAINELQKLQSDWQALAVDRKSDLLKKLEAKKAELVKDQKMMKVLNLQKALAEKKLALQKLIDMKQAAASNKEAQKQAAAQQEMVAKVLQVAKEMKDTKKPVASEKLQTVLTYLDARVKTVEGELAKLDKTQKEREDEIKATLGKKMPVQDGKDPMAKAQGVLKMLMKKEHRQYEKARVVYTGELKQLNQAIASIKKGDAAGLTKVMQQMQGEMKSLEAKSHKFLY